MKITYRPFGSYIDSEIYLNSINIVSKHPDTLVETSVTLEDFISKLMYKIDQLEQYVVNDKVYKDEEVPEFEDDNKKFFDILFMDEQNFMPDFLKKR
jgi:hypothetical protein